MFNTRRDVLKLMMLGSSVAVVPSAFQGCNSDDDNDDKRACNTDNSCFPQSIASGDPRPTSVVLWTRIHDDQNLQNDLEVTVELSLTDTFDEIVTSKTLPALAAYDHCAKCRVDNLLPDTTYYYRFIYDTTFCSKTGKTKTAPAQDSTRDVKYAFVSCQDFGGRYYNSYAHMTKNHSDLDFIVHLGDYIYETTGDPSFQSANEDRKVTFSDTEGAITLGSTDKPFYAAKSLSNYRELYQTFRSDTMLQKIHETVPMIAIWDDHEFSDDSYGASATYFDGIKNEQDTERKRNSERAYFEYMPIEVGLDESGVLSENSLVTLNENGDPVIYRDFHFGTNLHLMLNDYRSYRPDHLIPEDIFPGKVFADKATLTGLFEAQAPGMGVTLYEANKNSFGPYIDVDVAPFDAYKALLAGVATQQYMLEGLSTEDASARANTAIQGKISAYVANEMIKAYNATVPTEQQQALLYQESGDAQYESYEKGLAFLHMGKTALFSAGGTGSRYMVVKATFDIYAALQGQPNVFGTTQQAWMDETITNSTSKWLVFANSVSSTPMVLDLSGIETLPSDLKNSFYLNVDQMDGFPAKKAEILSKLRTKPNAAMIAGDIHASFTADHNGIMEYTGTSISSGTFGELLLGSIKQSPTLSNIDGIEAIVEQLDAILLGSNQAIVAADATASKMNFANTSHNGYAIMHVSNADSQTTYYLSDKANVKTESYHSATLNDNFTKFEMPKVTAK